MSFSLWFTNWYFFFGGGRGMRASTCSRRSSLLACSLTNFAANRQGHHHHVGFPLSSYHSCQRFFFGKTAGGGKRKILGAVLNNIAGRFFWILSAMFHCWHCSLDSQARWIWWMLMLCWLLPYCFCQSWDSARAFLTSFASPVGRFTFFLV